MDAFLSKKLVEEHCQCKHNLIGIVAYPKNNETNPILIGYSETLEKCECDMSCDESKCNYIDIFGVMLVKLATRLNDVSMCNLYITCIDKESGEFIDPLKNNHAAVRLLLHTGITVIHIKTNDGEIKYNRKLLRELLK